MYWNEETDCTVCRWFWICLSAKVLENISLNDLAENGSIYYDRYIMCAEIWLILGKSSGNLLLFCLLKEVQMNVGVWVYYLNFKPRTSTKNAVAVIFISFEFQLNYLFNYCFVWQKQYNNNFWALFIVRLYWDSLKEVLMTGVKEKKIYYKFRHQTFENVG